MKTTRNPLCPLILITTTLFLCSCKEPESNVQPEAAPAPTTAEQDTKPRKQLPSRSEVQNLMDAVSIDAIVPNPENRPLVTSQPAASPYEWELNSLKLSYQSSGFTDPTWNEKVLTLFTSYCDYTQNSNDHLNQLQEAVNDIASTGCSDPMVLFLKANFRTDDPTPLKKAQDLIQAYTGLIPSNYHPLFKYFAATWTISAAREADRSADPEHLCAWAMIQLEDAARDKNTPVDKIFDYSRYWTRLRSSKEWLEWATSDLDRLLKANWGKHERWYRYNGLTEIERGWDERGNGYIDTVSEEGFRGFQQHLKAAEESLSKAWDLNPKEESTAIGMMILEKAQGRGKQRIDMWFHRVMSINPDSYDGVRLMADYLEPKWHGSEELTLAFCRSVVASPKYGGSTSLILVNTHDSLSTYYKMADSPTYWQRPRVWEDIKASFTKFFSDNSSTSPETEVTQEYARHAYLCGQYGVFLDLIEPLTTIDYERFHGETEFKSMVRIAKREQEKAKTRGDFPER